MKKTNFNWALISTYRNIIYGLSCISIIIFHYCNHVKGRNTIKGNIAYLYKNIISSVGVEIFILLSGMFLYFSLKNNSNIKSFYLKRFQKILIPYLILGIPYWYFENFIRKDLGFKHFLYDISFMSFVMEGDRDIWYIFCILCFYLVYPLLFTLMTKTNNRGKRMILSLIVLSVVFNQLIYLVFPKWFIDVEIMLLRIPIFLIGVYLGEKVYNKNSFTIRDILSYIACLAITIICYVARYYKLYTFTIDIKRYLQTFMAISLVGLIIIICGILKPRTNDRIISKIGTLSLEYYLVHVLLISVLRFYKYPLYRYRYFALFLVTVVVLVYVLNYVIKYTENKLQIFITYINNRTRIRRVKE